MAETWFTSDTHFNHGNIIKYCHRPFLMDEDRAALDRLGGDWRLERQQVEAGLIRPYRISAAALRLMDDTIIDQINQLVAPGDTLWHLGDWAFANKEIYCDKSREYRDRIHCRNVNIIWGNHDMPFRIAGLFNENYHFHEINVANRRLVLCHYAMAVWNKSHRGAIHLYGHSHAGAEHWLDRSLPGRRSMDVGVDNAFRLVGAFRPFSLTEIIQRMDRVSGHSIDHHGAEN